ncbi:hypothetical protein LEP1GSC107_0429 [Leptospira interrogans serovar Grippotyphosa str. UI 12769]|nr:hypothetical protein LEP1GSC097_2083 [Leptospira interrogans serovar Grippotyphosa str. UI 08368]EMN86956.1 hypothetical protein LEP1GSC107_0429 [Leptospira interrogans serovar Grippotyphosa str. UI 12769]
MIKNYLNISYFSKLVIENVFLNFSNTMEKCDECHFKFISYGPRSVFKNRKL